VKTTFIGSRGTPPSKLRDSALWRNRPQWLSEEDDKWPPKKKVIATPESEEEVKKTACTLVVNARKSPTITYVVDISRHAKLTKPLRVTAWALRFTKNIRPGHEKIKGKDEVVRGANIRVIAKGKPLRMSRPVHKLYPLEVRGETFQGGELQRHAKENPAPLRRNPTRAAALDARWKTNSMLDS